MTAVAERQLTCGNNSDALNTSSIAQVTKVEPALAVEE